jgi:predicted nucleic-acid-binding protein
VIGLDTNVLVRYLAQDHPAQAKAATQLIEEGLTSQAPGFVSIVVLCEIIWVLEACYDAKREAIVAILETLMETSVIVVDSASAVRAALSHEKIDLADAIIHELGRARACAKTVTFDRKFARLDGVELLDSGPE